MFVVPIPFAEPYLPMHVHQLAELAGLAATNAPALIKGRMLVGETVSQQYWTASRCRLDRWSSSIKKTTRQLSHGSSPASTLELRTTCEEILASEILTRVWAAVARLYDAQHEVELLSPVAHNIYQGHLEARQQVLRVIADDSGLDAGLDAEAAVELNRLRRRCERWTDMLVGYLSGLGDVEEYVFDAERMRDFAEDLSYGRRMSGGPAAWALLSASLKTIFDTDLAQDSACADLNDQIAAAIMGCYPAGTFDGQESAKDHWFARITRTTADAQGMIDAFLSDADAPAV
jgi:hypothetical protein